MSAQDKTLLEEISNRCDSIFEELDIDNTISNSGTPISYEGEKISLNIFNKSNCYYSLFKETQGVGQDWQGLDVYGSYLFRTKQKGACHVYDLSTSDLFLTNPIGSFNLGSYSETNHAGVLCFTDIKMNEGNANEFPLLLVSDGDDSGHGYCYVERIIKNGNTFTSTLMATIQINIASNSSYHFYPWTQWHYYNGYLYTFGHRYRSDGS